MNKQSEQKKISEAIIRRLPRYYRYLGELELEGVKRISSGDFAELMGVTASQIRQDLNNFGGFGQQGYGYNVKYLREEIGHILGIDHIHNAVIIGAGNLGTALAGYKGFERNGFSFKAMFDIDPEKIGAVVAGLTVYALEDLPRYIKEHEIEIAAITTNKNSAQDLADLLKTTEIKGIWNFVHTDIKAGDGIMVQNVHLSESLMRLSYNISEHKSILKG